MVSEKQWRSALVSLNPYVSLTLGDLVDGCRMQVRRFVAELDAVREDQTVWGAHDYVGALHSREALARGTLLLQNDDREDAMREVADADADCELKADTVPDASMLLQAFLSADSPNDSWWWQRIPARRPVRDEIDSHKHARGGFNRSS